MKGHDHHDHGIQNQSNAKLNFAIFINVLLTVLQIVGGIFSGSLSLIADALHNLSDAGAIIVAVLARKIGQRPANDQMTYGHKRAEILGVVINSTTLILIGIYLIYQAIHKLFYPAPIDGWIVVWIASAALVIDVATAYLTYTSGAKDNMNLRAAFVHNLSDALASVVVIISGILIILYKVYYIDIVATIGISAYIIYHGILLMKKSIFILMQAVPEGINIQDIKTSLEKIAGVDEFNHIHVWQLDDKKIFLEGHVRLDLKRSIEIKIKIREILKKDFNIDHCTIENI